MPGMAVVEDSSPSAKAGRDVLCLVERSNSKFCIASVDVVKLTMPVCGPGDIKGTTNCTGVH